MLINLAIMPHHWVSLQELGFDTTDMDEDDLWSELTEAHGHVEIFWEDSSYSAQVLHAHEYALVCICTFMHTWNCIPTLLSLQTVY